MPDATDEQEDADGRAEAHPGHGQDARYHQRQRDGALSHDTTAHYRPEAPVASTTGADAAPAAAPPFPSEAGQGVASLVRYHHNGGGSSLTPGGGLWTGASNTSVS